MAKKWKKKWSQWGKLSVLLATSDDELKDRVLKVLEEHDCIVVEVNSCRDALQILMQYDFEFVMFDPDLKPLDGLDALKLIRGLRPQVPMVVITGDDSYETGVKIAEEGVYFRMVKPVDDKTTEEILQALENKRKKG